MIRNLSADKGTVLVELIASLVILVIIFIGTINISRILYKIEEASMLSREMAYHAYRRCRDSDTGRLNECLQAMANEANQNQAGDVANNIFPKLAASNVGISVYECQTAPPGCTLSVPPGCHCKQNEPLTWLAHVTNQPGNGTFLYSNIGPETDLGDLSFKEAFSPGSRVYIAEAEVRYDMMGSWLNGGRAHETTIY